MANLTSITLSSGNVTSSGSFSTIDNSFGTAGTSNVNVLSIQGISGGVSQSITGTIALSGTSNVAITGISIKASSVAPVVGDTALVVAISPNSVNSNGRKTPANSAPVVLNSMSYTSLSANSASTLLGSTGAIGDYIDGVLLVPASVSPGAVSIKDSTTAIQIFAGGTTSLTNLVPVFVPVGALSISGGWYLTTGSSIAAIVIGNFT